MPRFKRLLGRMPVAWHWRALWSGIIPDLLIPSLPIFILFLELVKTAAGIGVGEGVIPGIGIGQLIERVKAHAGHFLVFCKDVIDLLLILALLIKYT